MRDDSYNRRRLLLTMPAKGMVLGLLCCMCLLAEENVRAICNAVSRPLSGQPWSLEDLPAEMIRGQALNELLDRLSNASYLLPTLLIMLICTMFGFWEGVRIMQINKLRETVKSESERTAAVNSQLREQSLTDPLTGLANRRHFFEQLDIEIKRAERYGQPLSCMMLDLDFFKNVNDTFGHQFGDCVLRELADMLKAHCRQVDTPARYGGEEFAMLLPNTSSDDAQALGERLRKKVAAHNFTRNNVSTRLTISIGVASWKPEDSITQESLLYRSDATLYEVKASGRNGVLTWERAHHCEKAARSNYLDEQRMADLRNRLGNLSRDLKHTYLSAVNSLLGAVKVRDNYTLSHSYDVSYYAQAIAGQMGLSDVESEVIKNAANLHDLGKIGMDERMLCKPGKLTEKEFEVMKEHPRMAAEILRPLKFLSKEITLIIHHHERYDGTGYPHGLGGDSIPLGSRIIAVADAFSAMTTERPYRKAMSFEEATQEMVANSGSQFDPEVVRTFIQAIRSGKISLAAAKAGANDIQRAAV